MSDDTPLDRVTREAALAVLEPLAGLLLSREISYAQAEDLLKAAFVQASARAFAAQGKVPTVSNLSVASGIRRPEVRRLLENTTRPAAQLPSVAAQARLRWATERQFLDDAGQPRRLPRVAPEGEPSFAGLAALVSKDMHARALLDDMLRVGAVVEEGEFVSLRHRDYQPPAGKDELVRIAGANVGDHLSAALMNVLSGGPQLLERALLVDGLSQNAARQGTELAREAWAGVVGALRDRLQTLADEAQAPDNAWRMRIGVYAYYAPEQRPEPPVSAKRRGRPPGQPD